MKTSQQKISADLPLIDIAIKQIGASPCNGNGCTNQAVYQLEFFHDSQYLDRLQSSGKDRETVIKLMRKRTAEDQVKSGLVCYHKLSFCRRCAWGALTNNRGHYAEETLLPDPHQVIVLFTRYSDPGIPLFIVLDKATQIDEAMKVLRAQPRTQDRRLQATND